MTTVFQSMGSRADSSSLWALDSRGNELDRNLKAAQRFSLQEPSQQSWSDADGTEPILLRNLLSASQIDEVLKAAAVDGVWPRGVESRFKRVPRKNFYSNPPPCYRHRFSSSIDIDPQLPASSASLCHHLRSVAHHLAWTDEHVALYMHMNDWFVNNLPVPWSIIRGAMEFQPWMEGVPVLDDAWVGSSQSMEGVRCIELHHYSKGGGLTDPGHRDCGSALTMSVLLSDPDAVTGGDFVTYSDGAPVAHKMGRGDAILFHSEKLHNISTVTSGLRQSLVVELWPSQRY
jgi:hypothetical protein